MTTDPTAAPTGWHYGPTATDPEPGKMWHYGCGQEVLFIEDGAVCGCGASWDENGEPEDTDPTPAPLCTWPACLTPAQQTELADEVTASMLGQPTTPGPDQRPICGCREEEAGDEAALIRAPWTPEQVDALNRFQQSGRMHPFTCGGEHAPGGPYLVARTDGWHCSDPYGEGCDYRQDWAHRFMADSAPGSRCSCGGHGLAHFHADQHTTAPDGDGQAAAGLRERIAAVLGSLHAELWGAPASADFSPATRSVIDGGQRRTYLDIADAVIAVVHPGMDAGPAGDVARLRAELDRIAELPTVISDDGRADRFSTGARWTLRMIREVLNGQEHTP